MSKAISIKSCAGFIILLLTSGMTGCGTKNGTLKCPNTVLILSESPTTTTQPNKQVEANKSTNQAARVKKDVIDSPSDLKTEPPGSVNKQPDPENSAVSTSELKHPQDQNSKQDKDADKEENKPKIIKSLNEAHQILLYDYEVASKQLGDKITEYRHFGRTNSRIKLGLDGAAIAAGVTATALAVASPANAVAVAAFSGASAGLMSFQLMVSEEGFTREFYQKWIESMNDKRTSMTKDIADKLSKISSAEGYNEACRQIIDLYHLDEHTLEPRIEKSSGNDPNINKSMDTMNSLFMLKMALDQKTITPEEHNAKVKQLLGVK